MHSTMELSYVRKVSNRLTVCINLSIISHASKLLECSLGSSYTYVHQSCDMVWCLLPACGLNYNETHWMCNDSDGYTGCVCVHGLDWFVRNTLDMRGLTGCTRCICIYEG